MVYFSHNDWFYITQKKHTFALCGNSCYGQRQCETTLAMNFVTSRWMLFASLALAGCASEPPVAGPVVPVLPSAWVAPMPQGSPVASAMDWWSRFDDPQLVTVVEAAQLASPTLASALARVERARSERVAAGAALAPQLDGADTFKRERGTPDESVTNTRTQGLQFSWEIDLFGALRAGRDAQVARLQGAEAAWQAARVTVAAEAASAYVAFRACEALSNLAEVDSRSRGETARVSDTAERAGLVSSGDAATARASAAQGRSQVVAQRAQCDVQIKALVALTALDEPGLRARLSDGEARVPVAQRLAVSALPAALLSQRPDLMEAALAVEAAAADERGAAARKKPSVRLAGTVGSLRVSSAAGSVDGDVWSFGPLQVSFPVFDAGRRDAQRVAARATYTEAVALYQARIRQAVREVEQALVELDSTERQSPDVQAATLDYQRALGAAQERFRTGFTSVFELEDARRNAAASEVARVRHLQERTQAGISLFRALGGGWTAPGPSTEPASAASGSPVTSLR
jgi:multidrug efflux system outer membrane protein